MNEFNRSVEGSEKRIIERAYNNLDFRVDKETEEWVKIYTENLTPRLQKKMLHHIHRVQSTYIKQGMASMSRNIRIAGLGLFYYKKARKAFYDIKKENPDMELPEVVQRTKEAYNKDKIKQQNIKKVAKNREIHLDINK